MRVLRERLRTLVSRVKGMVVQDCPPELYACEVCGKLECDHEEWANCKQRLTAAEFMRSHNRSQKTASEPSKPANTRS